MASSGKKKTTMAKLMRESRLRERRAAKQARKDDRRRNAHSSADEIADESATSGVEDLDGHAVDPGVGTSHRGSPSPDPDPGAGLGASS